MAIIKLKSSDGEVFDTETEVVKCSGTIRTMLEDCGFDDNNQDDAVIPLANVESAILRRVLQWAQYHKNDPIPTDDEDKSKRTDNISDWDTDFLKIDQATLYQIILAANYLDIKGLMDSACKTVANMMKGKTSEEIRKTFNILNDMAEAEEGEGNEK